MSKTPRKTIARAVSALLLLLSSCNTEVATEPAAPAVVEPYEQALQLTEGSPSRVSGSYAVGQVGLLFSAERLPHRAEVVLKGLQGQRLLEVSDESDGVQTVSVLNGRLKQTISHRMLHAPASQTTALDASDFATAGDVAAARDLMDDARFALIPELSRALGELGLDGRTYPAALLLHTLALQYAKSAPFRAIRDSLPFDALRPKGLQPTVPCYPITCANGIRACMGGNGCSLGSEPLCPTNYGGSLQSNPCGNECYGMCGRKCSCWTWVCGDCNYHTGCAAHDAWCNACSLLQPWNCSLCLSPTALLAVECRL